jgi:hypothetical protein
MITGRGRLKCLEIKLSSATLFTANPTRTTVRFNQVSRCEHPVVMHLNFSLAS